MLKFGIIGAGMISQSGFDGLIASGAVEVVSVADKNETRASEFATKNKIGRYYTDMADIIKDPSLDAVYIALPTSLHAVAAEAALLSGKHVILDKPFALNLAEATKVADAVKKSGKLFMLGMNQRFAEGPQKIKALVEKDYFGQIYSVNAYWKRRSGIPTLGTWFGNKALSGGGCLLDIGVHMLDLALYTIGNFDVESVSGATFTKFGNRGLGEGGWGKSDKEGLIFDVDDLASAFIRLKGGAVLNLNVSWACHQKVMDTYNVEIMGTEAGATLYPGEIYRYDPVLNAHSDVTNLRPSIKYPHCNRFVNFVKAILGEEKPCVTIEESITIQRVLDAIYRSAKEGSEVRL